MKNITLLFALLLASSALLAQGTFTISPGASVKASGNVYVVLDNTHLVNNGSLQMAGGDGYIKFTGATDVNLSGSGTTAIDRLHVAKAASSNLLLQTNIAVTTEVNFSGGFLNLGSSVLDLGATAVLNNESEANRAFTQSTGYIQANASLNAPASVNMGNLGAIITSSANMGNTTIKRGNQVQVVSTGRNSILRYFDITPANNTGLNATFRFQYFDAELNTLNESTLAMWKSADNVNWTQVGNNSRDATANYVEKTGINDFSRWALAEELLTTYYRDADEDSYGNPDVTTRASALPAGYVLDNTDCNDNDATVHSPQQYYVDADHDGYGSTTTAMVCSSTATPGYSTNNTDCDDANAAIKPTTVWYLDADGDNYYTGTGVTQCTSPGTGYKMSGLTAGGDCNDANAAINPGATEVCNGIDDDCDGGIDEGVKTTWYRDADGDGFGNAAVTTQACTAPTGYVSNNTDCNDNNASVKPGAPEVCGNGIDDNCDGQIDEGCNNKLLVSINDASVYEAAGSVTLTVSLTKTSTQAVSVDYKTVDGTAISKTGRNLIADFTAKSGTLTVPAGSLSTTITLQIANDGVQEPTEQFTVTLSRPVNAGIDKGVGTVTILNGAAPLINSELTVMNKASVVNEVMVEKLAVKALPNPSAGQFTLLTQSRSHEVLKIKVTDALGRMVERRTGIAANSTLYLGNNYRPGIYFVEVLQGKQRQVLKLIKQ